MMKVNFPTFLWRSIAAQISTYLVFGMIFSAVLDYHSFFLNEFLGCYMRPTTDAIVAAGPILQCFRGILFAIVLYPLWPAIKDRRNGWLVLWGLFIGLAILGVCGAAPGSFEGMVYTQLPLLNQLMSLPETVLQTLAFSLLMFYWDRFPRRTMNIVMIVIVSMTAFIGVMGYLTISGIMKV